MLKLEYNQIEMHTKYDKKKKTYVIVFTVTKSQPRLTLLADFGVMCPTAVCTIIIKHQNKIIFSE